MVRTLWPDDAGERRVYLALAHAVQSFLAVRRLTCWRDLDVHAFVRAKARTPRKAIQLCLDLSGMLPWLIRSGELRREAATRLWLDLYEACPDDENARLSIELTMEHLGDPDVLAAAQRLHAS